MSNRVTLAQACKMDAQELAMLPTDLIALLLEDVQRLMIDAKRIDARMDEALAIRFSDRAATARTAENKETGRVSFPDGEFIVRADLPKKVEWDQTALASALTVVEGWGENVSDYVVVKMTVAESKFTAWPSTIKAVFESARTVSAGKASFTIERKAAA